MASLDQLTSLNPNDIFTKLKTIAAIVFGFFGAMHVLSAVAFALDKAHATGLVKAVRSKQFGYREEVNGAWTWALQQEHADEAVGLLHGPFSELCRLVGSPPVRLRRAPTPPSFFSVPQPPPCTLTLSS